MTKTATDNKVCQHTISLRKQYSLHYYLLMAAAEATKSTGSSSAAATQRSSTVKYSAHMADSFHPHITTEQTKNIIMTSEDMKNTDTVK